MLDWVDTLYYNYASLYNMSHCLWQVNITNVSNDHINITVAHTVT